MSVNGAGNALRTYYDDSRVPDQIARSNVLTDLIEKMSEGAIMPSGGSMHVISMHMEGNRSGMGARGLGVALPTAGEQVFDEAIIRHKYNFGVIRVEDVLMELSKNDKMAAVAKLQAEMDLGVKDFKDDLAVQSYNAETPARAFLDATDAGSGTTLKISGFYSPRSILKGHRISVITANGATELGTNRLVTSASYDSAGLATVVVDSAIAGRTAGDRVIIYRTAVVGSPARQDEMSGINASISNGSFQGLSHTDYDNWQASLLNGAGGDFTTASLEDQHIQALIDDVEVNSGYMIDAMLFNHPLRRKLLNFYRNDRRILDVIDVSGWKALNYMGGDGDNSGGIPMFVDRRSTKGVLWGINWDSHRFFEASDGVQWLDADGSILKWDAGYAAWVAVMKLYRNYGCYSRNRNGKVYGLTE